MIDLLSKEFLGIAAGVISVIAFIPYIKDILRGQTKPSGASWWTWAILAGITVTSSWYAGAPWQVLILPAWLCFSQLLVAILSLKYGDNTWDRTNKMCVVAAFLGVLLWFITGQPLLALIISIISDVFASLPNIRHVWKSPQDESRLGWFLGWLSSVFELGAVESWSWAGAGWPIYFFANMSIVFVLVMRPIFNKKTG